MVALYAVVMVTRPEWQAVNPFGPTQNSRFWGIGNQVETLLLAPLLAGAFLARRRFGIVGFVAFGFFGLVVMTDNRIGADGGGAIALGIALAVLGARLFRLGVKRLRRPARVGGARRALDRLARARRSAGPNHLRSAFSDHGAALLLVAREPLCRSPMCRRCMRGRSSLPLLLVLAASFALAWRSARQQSTRDVLLAFGVAIVTSLLVNDSAAYELAGGDRRRRRLRAFRPGTRDRAVARPCLRPREAPARSRRRSRLERIAAGLIPA